MEATSATIFGWYKYSWGGCGSKHEIELSDCGELKLGERVEIFLVILATRSSFALKYLFFLVIVRVLFFLVCDYDFLIYCCSDGLFGSLIGCVYLLLCSCVLSPATFNPTYKRLHAYDQTQPSRLI